MRGTQAHYFVAVSGEGLNKFYPKSSSLALLRRLADGVLFLVAAVHFESGPPSLSSKVMMLTVAIRELVVAMAMNVVRVLKVVAGAIYSSPNPTATLR